MTRHSRGVVVHGLWRRVTILVSPGGPGGLEVRPVRRFRWFRFLLLFSRQRSDVLDFATWGSPLESREALVVWLGAVRLNWQVAADPRNVR